MSGNLMNWNFSLVASSGRSHAATSVLELNTQTRAALREKVIAFSEQFLESLPNKKAYESDCYDREAADKHFEITAGSSEVSELLKFINRRVVKPGLRPATSGHLGYIPGGGIYTSALGDYLAAVINSYAGVYYASPGAVRMENALIDWVGQLVGFTGAFGGNLTSGGSIANLTALSAAKQAKYHQGFGLNNYVIYATQQTHHSIHKALRITGLDECVLRLIPVDEQYRMQAVKLKEQISEDLDYGLNPFLVIANAGSTDVGAIDPLQQIASIAEANGIWFHVDAAYGGFFLLTEYGKQRMKGIEHADSVILDPHKGLFLPYGSGMVLVREVQHLARAFRADASYMQDTKQHRDEYSPADLSPELSKHFRGLRMWLPLKLHGVEAFRKNLEEKLALTLYLRSELQDLGFDTGPEPDLSIVPFRFVSSKTDTNAFNRQLLQYIQEDGRIFLSSTTLDDDFWLRVAILSFRTHQEDIDLLIKLLEDFLEKNGCYPL
jgi:glutamate/tyrosine decarboxylase-like PLP-dependent enzyme